MDEDTSPGLDEILFRLLRANPDIRDSDDTDWTTDLMMLAALQECDKPSEIVLAFVWRTSPFYATTDIEQLAGFPSYPPLLIELHEVVQRLSDKWGWRDYSLFDVACRAAYDNVCEAMR